ncbi:DUF3472 domain-containing protein [Spirosoma endbachense]|uniref:DUF5077 domain-containing protein n=1 Tax=Spirosoma endbachense TaxID=2666025 RepID=A0A6P1VLG5_9BACT|nr:DUF5077 domain-containing protein [Spirosoma endbachense]QHV93525.1 DUF5077 domain-containing protein [Spirosoma endbachense]
MQSGIVTFLYAFVVSVACASNEPSPAGKTLHLSNLADTTLSIPLAGNGFITQTVSGGSEVITAQGLTNWRNPGSTASIYFRLDKTEKMAVSIRAKVPSGTSTIKVSVNGKPFTISLTAPDFQTIPIGSITVPAAGYVKVDLQGVNKTGDSYGEISDLIITGPAATSNVVFANDPATYYWSRRGPSVHLKYTPPAATEVEWFYNEITVPSGEDNIGSYYMANGFSGGYFGIQVNSATERRILFSVWDPSTGKTTLVRKGPNVTDNGFDGEGTGGQSYLKYNWKAGTSYRFLTHGVPDGSGNTLFSSWFFAPEVGNWQFIATWKKPNTTTYLTGLYSFLENFNDKVGYTGRKAFYTNQWVRSTTGNWIELATASFTGDATAKNRQRLDYAGGVENGQFFLQNGGFFANPVPLNKSLSRPATGQPPAVDLHSLPNVLP